MIPTRAPLLQVLLPLEPDEDIEDARRLLSALFTPSRTHVRRVYVQKPLRQEVFLPSESAPAADIARIELEAETATRAVSEKQMQPLSKAGFEVSAEVLHGSPRTEVLREAAVWPADLVAVRARRSTAPEERIGQMASALLHHAPCPVLLYRDARAGFSVRKVLVPVDFSASSREAVAWGVGLASRAGARCDLLHVVDEGAAGGRIAPEELVRMARAELALWRGPAGREGVGAEVLTARMPADGILQFAGQREYDLIVLPATGVSEVAAVLLGSTVRRVVRGTSLLVMVLPSSNRIRLERFLERAAAAGEPERSMAPA